MFIFTVLGFVAEGGKYFDVNLDIFAESPVDAVEKALRKQSNLTISSVYRSSKGRLDQY
jgi:hypothetical protein